MAQWQKELALHSRHGSMLGILHSRGARFHDSDWISLCSPSGMRSSRFFTRHASSARSDLEDISFVILLIGFS